MSGSSKKERRKKKASTCTEGEQGKRKKKRCSHVPCGTLLISDSMLAQRTYEKKMQKRGRFRRGTKTKTRTRT